ncbi:hypothetical protein CcaverHIS631_0604300 [Cutaneotrichosporon cavernicola]|nr:hypothetical protein CcaverHIS631_0604300 [Cutaneotrichosporon cavernicola]
MLTLFRRAALSRPTLIAVRAASGSSPGTTPDTGGPLFSTQFGAAAPREKPVEVEKKPESKAHKVKGGYSFAELKRLREEGRD